MFRSTATWIWFGLLASSLLVALPVTAQQPGETTTDVASELKQLQVNRVAVLKELTNLSLVGYRQGEFALDQVLAAQHDLTEAQLEMAETSEQRIALLETQLKIAQRTLEAAEQLSRAREVSVCDVLRAKAALMGVEIKLLQESDRAKPTPK